MSKDIRVALSFFNHHKTKRLHREFGDSGIVSLWKLWSYCAVHQQDGDLSKWDTVLFQIACERDTDCMQFVERLASKEVQFLDKNEHGKYSIHDWREHQPWVYFAKDRSEIARENVKKRWLNKGKNTSGIPVVNEPNTIGNTPSPSPSPKILRKATAPNPEIRVVIDYFSDQYKIKFGNRPLLGGKDAALVKMRLRSFTADGLKKAIDHFLESPKAKDHPTLAAAMSNESINLWEQKIK